MVAGKYGASCAVDEHDPVRPGSVEYAQGDGGRKCLGLGLPDKRPELGALKPPLEGLAQFRGDEVSRHASSLSGSERLSRWAR
jgi:hypothetical protein